MAGPILGVERAIPFARRSSILDMNNVSTDCLSEGQFQLVTHELKPMPRHFGYGVLGAVAIAH